MTRAGTYGDMRHRAGSTTKDLETWLANSLATVLAGLGVAGGVIGFLVAMGYLDHPNSLTDFDAGIVWMFGGLILAIAANVFRREHHMVDPRDVEPTHSGGETYRSEPMAGTGTMRSETYRGEPRTR